MLRSKLLDTKLFIENIYFDQYINLVQLNKEKLKEKFVTQSHHIIPRCYYIHNSLAIDESSNNLVNLEYKDHLLAHYYLSLCSNEPWFVFANELVLNLASQNYKGTGFNAKEFLFSLPEYQTLYNHMILEYSKDCERNNRIGDSLRGRIYVSKENDIRAIHREQLPYYLDNGYIVGNNKLKNKTPVTDGNITLLVDKTSVDNYINNGYRVGHSHKTSQCMKDYKTIHKGNTQKRVHFAELDIWFAQGWELGVKSTSKSKQGHPAWNKGTKGITPPTCKNKKWVNNGVDQLRIDNDKLATFLVEHPDYKLGQVGYCWINDGKNNIKISKDELQKYLTRGFVQGMVKRKCHNGE